MVTINRYLSSVEAAEISHFIPETFLPDITEPNGENEWPTINLASWFRYDPTATRMCNMDWTLRYEFTRTDIGAIIFQSSYGQQWKYELIFFVMLVMQNWWIIGIMKDSLFKWPNEFGKIIEIKIKIFL